MKFWTVAAGAGYAGDRVDPAVRLASSGVVNAVVLECLAERTLVAALRARQTNPKAGHDVRLRRRLTPLLPAARQNHCRVISNLGAANPDAAMHATAELATELGLSGLKIASVTGDDVMPQLASVEWQDSIDGNLLGAFAYLGTAGLIDGVRGGADVVLAGRVADSALFAAELIPQIEAGEAALAGAIGVGHLLECSGQLTGGNYEPPGGRNRLTDQEFADLGYPIARVMSDGSAEITLVHGDPGIVDIMTCTLQLLYEVHDPHRYITPDAIIDLSGVQLQQVGPNRVSMRGVRYAGRPTHLKVVGFVEGRGIIADCEIGFAGPGAIDRARSSVEILRRRLDAWAPSDINIDLVGVDSILGAASDPVLAPPPEVRVHVSARCEDAEAALIVEDEVIGLTIVGPAGAAGIRSERRSRIETITGFIPRERVTPKVAWCTAR